MNMNYVCFNITSECNMKCPYCYRVGNTKGYVGLKKAKKYIDFLLKHGCRTINITGGEPLLNKEWKNIIEYCKSNGMFVVLSTNGLQLELNDEILEQIDVLSLPLDGGSSEINSKTRSVEHFLKVKELISEYINGKYSFTLKVNTVLTGFNYKNMDEILLLLNSENIVWKIFELRKKGEYYHFPEDKVISDIEIQKCVLHLISKKHKCKLYFMGKQIEDTDKYNVKPNYIVLDYNGDIYLADEEENRYLFNINSSFENIETIDEGNGLLNNQYQEELKNDII